MDVCHTSTHGVAYANFRCKPEMCCCARFAGNAEPKKIAKNRLLGTIAQLYRVISSQRRHVYRQSEKNLLNSNISSTCPDNMVNFGLVAAEIGPVVWAPQLISTAFASWQRYCTAFKYSERQPNFAALNRGRHQCSAGRPSRWALAHILFLSSLTS